jgi:hypothetical protein
MFLQKNYFLTHGRHYVTYNNESNLATVDKIIVLVEEIAVLKSRYEDTDTGHLRTTVNVLENRVQELRERIHN